MAKPRIVVFGGSARRASYSKQLARACVAPLEAAGGVVEWLDLADFPAPLYHGDLEHEAGLPATIVDLQQRLAASDGLLVVSPEYNGSVTPLLKNTLDWCSRPNPTDKARSGVAVFGGRAAAVMASSPGPLGGIRVLFHVRDILGYLGMLVIPQQLAVGKAAEVIGADGRLTDEKQQGALESVCRSLVDAARSLRGTAG
ncbi:MAG: NADPH-dependent FMN reductase [Planctomycetota bacterium]